MKIPRDLTGRELAKLLVKYDYKVVRQTGSHIRLKTEMNGEHAITIPDHSPIKIGTLNSILREVAMHFNVSKDNIVATLFG